MGAPEERLEQGEGTAADGLALPPATMRRLGYRVVDMLVDAASRLSEEPLLRTATPREMAARLAEPAPEEPRDHDAVLDRVLRDVLPWTVRWNHPRMFGYIPGSGTWPAALGDFIASAWNIDASSWREAAGPTQLELTVLDWFREWIGYPEGAAGILLSGGSAANMTAIACAREAVVGAMSNRIVAYVSDQSHSSIARSARNLGFRPDQLRAIPTDGSFRIRPGDLAAAIDADAAAGRLPFLVAAAAGSTNTGAIDHFAALHGICGPRGIWLHVDGAYGGFAVLTERGAGVLDGIALADSVTLDPHKWLSMPFEVGCLMVRDGAALERAFRMSPEYLKDRDAIDREVNFGDRGMQLTRAGRALKVWLSIQMLGLGAFRSAIDRALDLALLGEELVRADDRLELVTPASLGIVTFRRRFPGTEPATEDELNKALVARLATDADLFVTSTILRGRYTIRLCVLNHATAEADVRHALARIASADPGTRIPSGTAAAPTARETGLDVAWLTSHSLDPEHFVKLPPFEGLTTEQAARFLGSAREETYAAGEHVVDRWAFSRTFYLVLGGRLSVEANGREVNVLGPGDHFGEIAAIDWGRDFTYGRTATVVAIEETRLLAFQGAALNELMHEAPELDRAIRRAASERLARA